ncbi:MAG: hypothetical protein LBP39_02150 [Rickettsiales bacterium]|jgi:hypothetical protein|nr:hypothetical protein [Rickettsiales bacterium]
MAYRYDTCAFPMLEKNLPLAAVAECTGLSGVKIFFVKKITKLYHRKME